MSKAGKSRLVRALFALVILAIVSIVALVIWFRLEPIAALERSSRRSLEKMGLERAELELSNGSLVYWRGGHGQTLVLLHGAGHQAGTWATVAEDLMKDHRLLILDLPGHGESDPASGPILMRDLYGGVEAFLQAQPESDLPIVMGNSLGAWLGMLYAHRHPDALSRLVALNGGAITNDLGDLNLLPRSREEARHLVESIRDPSNPRVPDFVLDDLVERSETGPVARFMPDLEGMGEHLLDGRLGEIRVPVDLVWGESDGLMSLGYAQRMADKLPHVRLTVVSKCGHIPHNECPDRLLDVLHTILSSQVPVLEIEPGTPHDDGVLEAEGVGL